MREGQESLADAAQQYAIGGYPAGLSTLLAIGRVVVLGLEPLRHQVQRDLGLTAASDR
jgi:hypothetical protein